MITITSDIDTTMQGAVMPAFLTQEPGIGASVSGRRLSAGHLVAVRVRVPAYTKDAFPGVRAWSPPVL